MSNDKDHDLSAAELRAINDLRTAARKLAAAFKRNRVAGNTTHRLIGSTNQVTRAFDLITGQAHELLEMPD